jgi:Nickel/cobalt transporter regulator
MKHRFNVTAITVAALCLSSTAFAYRDHGDWGNHSNGGQGQRQAAPAAAPAPAQRQAAPAAAPAPAPAAAPAHNLFNNTGTGTSRQAPIANNQAYAPRPAGNSPAANNWVNTGANAGNYARGGYRPQPQQRPQAAPSRYMNWQRDRGGYAPRWDRDGWRRDRGYDWQGWRRGHENWFRLGAYLAPPGYYYSNYYRFGIGGFLAAEFYRDDYWIYDPSYYRLPAVAYPYRWIRYYNDVLLIDARTGLVADVVYGFFY